MKLIKKLIVILTCFNTSAATLIFKKIAELKKKINSVLTILYLFPGISLW